MEKEMKQFMDKYDEISCVLECSAKARESREKIDFLFWNAQKQVLYPRQPLYTGRLELTSRFVSTLSSIFLRLDSDKDGYLDDNDLSQLQLFCFGEIIGKEKIDEVKKSLVIAGEEEGMEDKLLVQDGKISFGGFTMLFILMLERGTDTVWTILRKFGYDNRLLIQDDCCLPCPPLSLPTQKLEFGQSTREYLLTLFNKFSKNSTTMNMDQWSALSSLIPSCVDFNSAYTDDDKEVCATGHTNALAGIGFPYCCRVNWIDEKTYSFDFSTFISGWSLALFLDHKTTLRQLAYLGVSLQQDGTSVVRVTTNNIKTRSVVKGCVFGSPASGKSTMIASLINCDLNQLLLQCTLPQPSSTTTDPIPRRVRAINEVEISLPVTNGQNLAPSKGRGERLLLEELTVGEQEELLSQKGKLDCDIAIFVYDQSDPESFSTVQSLLCKPGLDLIPRLVVATKGDLKAATLSTNAIVPSPITFSNGSSQKMFFELIMKNAISQSVPSHSSLWSGVGYKTMLTVTVGVMGAVLCIWAGKKTSVFGILRSLLNSFTKLFEWSSPKTSVRQPWSSRKSNF
eukprot:TRINITY_DN3428_c0_g1_i19.p1 TRINITY_DN3428_c0_g1~~TRINITY_DN3428_c0_g1_i19.p1  ORF type:complete len:568 (+),score=115.31 TRINITY_DN3428_c0_g1_i19:577-2280(+)